MMPIRNDRLAALVAFLVITGTVMLSGCSRTQGQAQPTDQTGTNASASSTQAGSSTPATGQSGQSPSGDQSLITNPITTVATNTPASQGDPANGPKATFFETIFDAGTVEAGQELKHVYKVKNVGKTDLAIESVKPG